VQQPIQLLSEFEDLLKQLNRSKIPEARRVEILTLMQPSVVIALEQAFTRFQSEHTVPETDNRKRLLGLCNSVTQEFSIGYLRVCDHDFKLSNPRFQKALERVTLCTHRVLEFIYLQQRFRALRYQVLDKDCWSNVNQLIFAAFFENLHESSLSPLLCLKLHGQNHGSVINVAQLSAMIHLFAAANVCTLPIPAIHALADYVHRCRLDYQLREQTDSPGKNGVLQISHVLDHCAEKYLPLDLQPVLEICYNQLQLTLRSESERLISIFEKPMNNLEEERFVHITAAEDIEKLLSVSAALNHFSKDKRTEEREYVGRFDPLTLNIGYKQTFDILSKPQSAGPGPNDSAEWDLQDDLPHRNKGKNKDNAVAKRVQWTVVNRSNGGALIETYDTEFERRIFVGQLVSYSESKNAGEDLRLAYITRLHRDYMHGKLQMALVNICHTFKPVAVQSQALEKNALALPGVLCFDYSDYPALILHVSHRLQPNTPVSLRFDQQKVNHSVDDILLIKREFILYQLSQPYRRS